MWVAMLYRFGSCELASDRRELIVAGQVRAVAPQVFDLILHFAANADRLISHDELIREIRRGRIVSDSAISARISAARAAIGDDGTRQRFIKTVPRHGFRFVARVETDAPVSVPAPAPVPMPAPVPPPTASALLPAPGPRQQVRFCRSADGTRIAFATTGDGYPLVKAGHWLTHLDHDWHSPIWHPFLDRLGQRYRVIRYDQRGNGLSDWNIGTLSLDRFVEDLEAVVDAAGPERFALYGTSQGAPIAIAYACRHPERVSHLILHGGYQSGRLLRSSDSERSGGEAILTLIRTGWGQPGSHFLKMFATMFLPDGSKDEIDALVELQRLTTSAANAARIREAVDRFDVRPMLAQVQVPALVMHARNDGVHPVDQGLKLAVGIPGARFVMLESANHIVLQNEPAWDEMFDALNEFIGTP